MRRLLLSTSTLLIACFLPGCETDDGGRMRMGIHDPIERHRKRSGMWPFQREEKARPAPIRPAAEDGGLPEDQPSDSLEPG